MKKEELSSMPMSGLGGWQVTCFSCLHYSQFTEILNTPETCLRNVLNFSHVCITRGLQTLLGPVMIRMNFFALFCYLHTTCVHTYFFGSCFVEYLVSSARLLRHLCIKGCFVFILLPFGFQSVTIKTYYTCMGSTFLY